MAQLPSDLQTHLGWRFESVLPGTFRRNKKVFAHIDFPILAPLPHKRSATETIEGASLTGPFIYFVLDRAGEVCYVGKSKEKSVVKRWVRLGIGGPATHYWTHTNVTAGCVRRIALGITEGRGPYQLRFVPVSAFPYSYVVRFASMYPGLEPLDQAERGAISILHPVWNPPKC